MMLWDIIRDFFVKYIFGGLASDSYTYSPLLGNFYTISSDGTYMMSAEGVYVGDYYVHVPGFENLNGPFPPDYLAYISLGDYLSTTATIIVLTLICVAIGMAVVWLFKEVYRMITRWAF